MNTINKLSLRINVDNLNKIPIEKISNQDIYYAIKLGFNYKKEVDNRYDKFNNYIDYNLKEYPEYKNYLLDKYKGHFEENNYIRQSLFKQTENDLDFLIKMINYNPKLISNYDYFDSLSEDEKSKLLNVLINEKQVDYEDFNNKIKKDNYNLGILYLKNDFNNNISSFLKYNQSVENVDEFISLIPQNSIDDELINRITEIVLKSQIVNIDSVKKIISLNKNNINNTNIIINKYPDVIDVCDNLYFNHIRDTVYSLIMNDKYKISKNTPLELIKSLLESENITQSFSNILQKDFLYYVDIFKEKLNDDDYLKRNIHILRRKQFYDICKNNNYYLTNDSPLFLKYNPQLLIESIEKETIDLSTIDISKYTCLFGIPFAFELVDAADRKHFVSENIQTIKDGLLNLEIVDNKIKMNQKLVEIDNFFNTIPNSVNNILFNNQLGLTNVTSINQMIDCIKKYNKNVKLSFRLDKAMIDSDILDNISDLNYIQFYPVNEKDVIISADNIVIVNETIEDIANDLNKSDLSDFEKYIAAYDIVKSFKPYKYYMNKEQKDVEFSDRSRSVYLTLENDCIVCQGYTCLLASLLKTLNIEATQYCWYSEEHSIAYVFIDDSKYGIKNIIKCDPTHDSIIEYDEMLLAKNYNYISNQIVFNNDDSLETPFDKFLSKKITFSNDEFDSDEKEALTSLYNKNANLDVIPKEKLAEAVTKVFEYVYGEIDEEEKYFLKCSIIDDRKPEEDINKYREYLYSKKYPQPITYENNLCQRIFKEEVTKYINQSSIDNIRIYDYFDDYNILFQIESVDNDSIMNFYEFCKEKLPNYKICYDNEETNLFYLKNITNGMNLKDSITCICSIANEFNKELNSYKSYTK